MMRPTKGKSRSVEALFLEAVSAGIHGQRVLWTTLPTEQWLALFRLAESQKLLPILMDAVCECEDRSREALFSPFQKAAMYQVAAQTRKDMAFFSVYEGLERAGIPALVVKGSVCRSVYPNGVLRISSDEDLLVEEERFAEACRVLSEAGLCLRPGEDPEGEAELEWRSPDGLVFLELHKQLFSQDAGPFGSMQRVFPEVFSAARAYPLEGGLSVLSLSPQDHLLYLLLHAMKHFIQSGVGLRQICDAGLWAERWKAEIDWELLWRQAEQVRGAQFCAALLRIAEEDLEIDLELPPRWRRGAQDPEPLLRDSLDGGIYGSSTMARRHTARITREAVAGQGLEKRSGLLAAVFPPAKSLERDYPELKEHPARLPLVWQKRLARYLKQAAASPTDRPTETVRLGKQRVELLRSYGILNE